MRSPELDSALSDARGFAMAVLLVGIAVMLTLMTVALPVWRQQAKREKEEELLFRQRQYAHALALYQRKFPGAAPTDLDELVKQKFLRKKYKDPITGKDFAILRVGQVSPGMTTPLPGVSNGQPPSNTRLPTTSMPGSPGTIGGTTGPIRGVVSTSKDASLRSWKGRTQYDQWEVLIEDITPRFFGQQQQGPQGNPSSRRGGAADRGPFGGATQPQPGLGRPGPYNPRP